MNKFIGLKGAPTLVVEGNRYNERGDLETVSIQIREGKITGVQVYANADVDLPLVMPSIGHTTASFDDVAAAKSAGFRHITHLCNAMQSLLHRAVGPIGYLVGDEDFTADIISDGVHLDEMMVKTLLRAVGTERLVLITDAIRAAAMPEGMYDLGGLNVTLKDGACRLVNGTLAGSVLTMSTAVRRLQQLGGVSGRVAQDMASLNPAHRLNLSQKGQIAPNFDADLVALDGTGEVLWTMVGGNKIYEI